MAKKKPVIEFDAQGEQGIAMHRVISVYAHTAYPVGGSDCAAATRTALLNVAEKIQTNDRVDIGTRQRPMLKAAVNWYFAEVEKDDSSMSERLLSQLQKPANR